MAVEYAQVAVTAGTLVLGAGIAFVADARKNGWLYRRECVAAERQDARERKEFERATLIDLQDWLAKLTRATGAIRHADEMEFRSSQRWGLPVGDWSDRHGEALVNVNRLRVRLLDVELRSLVDECTNLCVAATMGRVGDRITVLRPTIERVTDDTHVDPAADADPDDGFKPRVGRPELPQDVRTWREREQRDEERFWPLIEPRIEGWIAAHSMALDTLDRAHQQLADETDIELAGETRWTAMWQMSGRCLGYARALLVLARGGFGDEALPTGRALHESCRLLDALTDPDEPDLLRRWLADDDDDYVRPGHARAAIERGEQRMDDRMRAAGAEPSPGTLGLTRELYHRMSVVAHNRRSATQSVVSVELRRMSRGRHPNAFARAAAVRTACAVVEECVQSVADSLARFYGPRFLTGTLRPMLESFAAVRDELSLDDDVLRRLG